MKTTKMIAMNDAAWLARDFLEELAIRALEEILRKLMGRRRL